MPLDLAGIKVEDVPTKRTGRVHSDGPVVTPELDRFLASARDGDVRARGVVHPSAISGCERALTYELLSAPMDQEKIPARLRRIFDNGTYFHRRMQKYLKQAGILKADEVSLSWKKYRVKGHADGIIRIVGHDDYVLELKSINEYGFQELRDEPDIKHVWQAHLYMMCLKLDQAVILYENKNNQGIKEFVIQKDKAISKAIIGVLKRVNRAAESGDLPERVCANIAEGKKCYCRYRTSCFKDKAWKNTPPKEALR